MSDDTLGREYQDPGYFEMVTGIGEDDGPQHLIDCPYCPTSCESMGAFNDHLNAEHPK